jgi:hypothetical protein
MKDKLSCSKCSYASSENVTRCPQCGNWMPRAQGVRRRGWVLIVLGALLVAMMGAITFLTAPTMLSRGSSSGARFTGTPEQALLILGLFGIVIIFGITCIGSGLWQIVTGRRSIWIVVIVLGLTFLLIVAASAVMRALDRGSDRTKVGYVGDCSRFLGRRAETQRHGRSIESPTPLS